MADLPPIAPEKPLSLTSESPINGGIEEMNVGPSSKEIMIGSGALLVLALVYFFIRNAYVNFLVSSLKRSPNNAGLAGWGLFGCLLFASAIGCLALVSKSLLTVMAIVPLAAISLICLILCIVISSKK